VIALPPSDVGAAHVTAAVLPLKVAAIVVGAPGALDGVTAVVEVYAPYPPIFLAFTFTKYSVPMTRSPPLMSAVNVASSAPVVVLLTVVVSAVAVTVYSVIASSLTTGEAHVILTLVVPSVAVVITDAIEVATPGTIVTALETSELVESPALLLALTLNEYADPRVRPVTVHVKVDDVQPVLAVI
jgi:hypothetical protein